MVPAIADGDLLHGWWLTLRYSFECWSSRTARWVSYRLIGAVQ